MRPKLLFAVLVCSLVVAPFLGTPAGAQSRPALFTDQAGFHHARFAREPIRVQGPNYLSIGMQYWNARAGWPLFVFADSPEVTANYRKDCGFCAFAYSALTHQVAWGDPYERCEVSLVPSARDEVANVAHELGHCLGLRHQTDGVMTATGGGRIEPGYKRFDRGLMIEAGYAPAV